jgi:RNA polymerase sigma factor (sigma-70 family)
MADDFELLGAWGAGDQKAGNELFDRHFSTVFRFFRSKAEADAEDLTQRTFLACVEQRDDLKPRTTFRAYVLGIARHLLFRRYRERRKQARIEDFLTISVDDAGRSPSQVAQMAQEQKLLSRALRAIPIDFQIAIELHYWEGMSVAEVAQVLEVAPGTVKSRLHRGREMLRTRLENLAESPDLLRSTIEGLDRWAASLKKIFDR